MFKVSSISNYLLLYILINLIVNNSYCDRIHFTNSQNHLANQNDYTTYKLDIPGSSNGITIIEANDKYKHDTSGLASEDESFMDNFNKSDSVKTVYAPMLLHKFLFDYNNKKGNEDKLIKDTEERGYYPKKVDKYNSHHPIIDQDAILRPNIGNVGNVGNSQSYNSAKKNPFQETEGWVTLEAIPWSKSKVSIWKPNMGHVRPLSDSNIDTEEMNYRFDQKRNPFSSNENENNSFMKNKQYLHRYDINNDRLKDTLNVKPLKSVFNSHYKSNKLLQPEEPEIEASPIKDRWYEYDRDTLDRVNKMESSDLLENYNNNNEHQHPDSYPTNGNGEWVLVSTTKGYQRQNTAIPPKRTNKMDFNETPHNTSSFRMHKSVKLTVLPPINKNTKMVLSHGGLIEIAVPKKAEKIVGEQVNNANNKDISFLKTISVKNNPNIPDKSAVLAAVSAGMIPATMAMIMPLLGRRKRDLSQKKTVLRYQR